MDYGSKSFAKQCGWQRTDGHARSAQPSTAKLKRRKNRGSFDGSSGLLASPVSSISREIELTRRSVSDWQGGEDSLI